MRILLATGIYPPESGGPATYTHGLAEALAAKGHSVTVVTYGQKSGRSRIVHHVSRSGGPFLRYARYAWRTFMLARHVDVIYAQGAVSEGLPATVAAWLSGRPVLMRVPGDYAWEMAQQRACFRMGNFFGRNSLRSNIRPAKISHPETWQGLDEFLKQRHRGIIGWYERIERWTARRARRVIVPSRYLQSVVERWGVPRERIEVIKSVTEPLPHMEDREAIRDSFEVTDRVVCLTAVRAVPWKGVAELVRWWREVPSTHTLIVAGEGPELERWRKLAIEEGVTDRVRFLGRIDRHVLAKWYEAADVFILHTGYEGYPHVVAEAASFGLPCLVSDQGGNPETREDFGDLVRVLPYQNGSAWVEAIAAVEKRRVVSSSSVLHAHTSMVENVERVLTETVEPERGYLQTVMVSYDRALLDTSSDTFTRVSSLADEKAHLKMIVLAGRIFQPIREGIRAAKLFPGRTIVTAQDPFAAGLVGYLISRLTDSPLEIQEHGDFFSGEWVKESWKNRLLSFVGWFVLRRAERVRVVSERVRTHLIVRGVAAAKIEVIPVAQAVVGGGSFTASDFVQDDSRRMELIAPCRFVPQKGLDVLLEAVTNLKKNGRVRFHLSLVGAGSLENWIRLEIRRRGLEENVELRPWQSQADLWKDADIFVMSSRYEGWGRTIVEAMAAGVSVVATEVGCVGSFFRPGIDGLAVPVGDAPALAQAIETVALDKQRRLAMLAAAHERAATFPARDTLHAQQRRGWREMFSRRREVGPRWDLWIGFFLLFVIASRTASVILFHGSLVNREWGFYTLVDHWFRGFGYSYPLESGCASAYRSPGYLFFLTALYTLFKPENTWAQAIVQNLFVVAALLLVYAVGKKLVGRRAALVGGFLMAAYPYTFYHYTQYYHTFLSSFFLLLIVWFLLRLQETRAMRHAVGSGFAIACMAYVQGTILPVTPFFAAWICWQWWPNWKRALRAVAVMALVAIALIAPWTYRNWKVFHRFVPLTTDLGHAFFKANNEVIYELTQRGYPQEIVDEETVSSTDPNFKQYRMPIKLEEDFKRDGVFRDSVYWTEWHPLEPGLLRACPHGTQMSEYDFNQYWLAKGKTWLKENWWTEGWKLQVLKVKTFWQPNLFPSVKTGAPWSFAGNPIKVWLAKNAMTAASAIIIFGGWIGVFFALRRRNRAVWIPLAIFVVYTFLHTFFAGYTKYRIPLDNLLAVYAGWAIVKVWDKMRGKKGGEEV